MIVRKVGALMTVTVLAGAAPGERPRLRVKVDNGTTSSQRMLRPDLFGGRASHAGDALYELTYIQGLGQGRPRAARLRRVV